MPEAPADTWSRDRPGGGRLGRVPGGLMVRSHRSMWSACRLVYRRRRREDPRCDRCFRDRGGRRVVCAAAIVTRVACCRSLSEVAVGRDGPRSEAAGAPARGVQRGFGVEPGAGGRSVLGDRCRPDHGCCDGDSQVWREGRAGMCSAGGVCLLGVGAGAAAEGALDVLCERLLVEVLTG